MPTLKRKVEMNLPQLIEWLFRKRNLDDEIFLSNKHNRVQVTDDGILEFFGTFYDDIFTVEVEEEITEDTVLDAVVIVRKQINPYGGESTHVCRKGNVSINQALSLQPNNSQFIYLEIYLMKNDRIDQLIWTKEKGLVD